MQSKALVSVISIFLFFGGYAQQKSVIISENDKKNAEEHVLLEVNSDSKGILLPRMTLENMYQIKSPEDGLSVYVLDDNAEGIWYWDGALNLWVRLTVDNSNQSTEPLGTIVAYTGSLIDFDDSGLGSKDSDKRGWAICNGVNGTPNLSSTFLVGAGQELVGVSGDIVNYPTVGGAKVGSNSYTISEQQMAEHTHPVNDLKVNDVKLNHQHAASSIAHGHNIGTFNTGGKDKWRLYIHLPSLGAYQFYKIYGAPDLEWFRERHEMFNVNYTWAWAAFTSTHFDADYTHFQDPGLTLSNSNSKISIPFTDDFLSHSCGNTDNPNNAPDPIDNKPSAYVVVFIMKVGDGLYNGEPVVQYAQPKAFNK